MSEVFKIQNISLAPVALIDFGLIIPPNEIVELENFDQTLLSPQLNTLLNDGTLVRLINDVSVPYSEAFTTTTQIYNFDSSTVDGSINQLFAQDIIINASLGIRPLTTYVDGSLNFKVNQTLFDSSITSLTNKNISQDASITLKADKTYVDASISVFATNASVGIAAFAKNASLGLYATNVSINSAGFLTSVSLNPYATNASVGIALQPYATNASVGLAIAPFTTNASINSAGFAKQSYVDSSLVLRDSSITWLYNNTLNISALNPYATNASVGLALGAYATNSSINLYATKTDASIVALRNSDITINASIGLRPLTTYVDGSLNLRVLKTLFDSSIAALTTKNINQDTSINNNAIAISAKVYGTEYQLAEDLTSTSTTSTSPVVKLTMTTTNLPAGTYKVTVGWVFSRNSASNSALYDIQLNGTSQGTRNPFSFELSDTTDIRPASVSYYLVLSGVNTITLRHWGESGANSTTTSDAKIELIRIA